MSDLTRWWALGQRGWPERFVVVQFPNAPLLIALAASVAGRFVGDSARPYTDAVFSLFAAAWAWLELTDGANWFRRAVGAGFLAYLVVRVGSRLG
ncbi:MAG: hypothetical protein JHC84_16965 [Solirubrobacteraceae bacterium]|nr:hypothetical protein [Solirubrobacteraceae bacterium]